MSGKSFNRPNCGVWCHMTLDENTKAFVRQFLVSEVAQQWLDHCLQSCPKLELGKVDRESYIASLLEESGWRKGLLFAVSCVQELPPVPDYGRQPIDTVTD